MNEGVLKISGKQLGFWFALIVVYWVTAAAAFNGYYQKWQFFDGNPKQSVVATIAGSAERPYVYRQLLPEIANAAEGALPDDVAQQVETRLQQGKVALKSPEGRDAKTPGYTIQYRIVYYLTFLSLFAALFVLRSIALDVGLRPPAATAAPIVFALMAPILQTRGGYFYDYPEILAFALAAKFAIKGWSVPLVLLAAPAALNKEAFFFYCATLLPLLMKRLSFWRSSLTIGAAMLVAGLSYLYVRIFYAANPGGAVIPQLLDNLAFYANPLNLLQLEVTYGVAFFKGYGLVVLGWFALAAAYGWRETPIYVRHHLALAAVVNLPLLIAFCAGGEMRNLSMLYVGVVLLIAGALQRLLREQQIADVA